MPTTTVIVLIVVVLAVLAIIVALNRAAQRRRRTAALQGSFGPEYDRTVEQTGDRQDAERALAERQAKHEQLDIRPLTPASRQRYTAAWSAVQTRFIDAPVLAFTEADHLLTQLLQERGYPTGDVEEQAGLLSVEHGRVLDNYRAGHVIEQQNSSSSSDTEQVRQGMLHFRTVFEELLGDDHEVYPSQGGPERSTAERATER